MLFKKSFTETTVIIKHFFKCAAAEEIKSLIVQYCEIMIDNIWECGRFFKKKTFTIQPSLRIILDIRLVSHFVYKTWYSDQDLLTSKLVENLICIDVV